MKEQAVNIVRVLRRRGFKAYLVGGCVRDLLLGREPADYDVATDALPKQVMEIFPRTYAVGAQFGVVLVPCDEPANNDSPAEHCALTDQTAPSNKPLATSRCIEVPTFRRDVSYSDGRHPDAVQFTGEAKEDVQRRDFTINGLLLDPLNGDEVLDFVGGRADLEQKIIRAIGEPQRRFREDKLRMLRAVRFAARFGYEIEAATFAAIREQAEKIHEVSRER